MKKIIALFLSLLMLLSVCLTGCSEKTDEEAVEDISKKASKSAMTLSVYLMSEEPVEKCKDCTDFDAGVSGAKKCTDQKDKSPCTFRLVSNAVNRITESKFKTRLILHYYTEAEYYQKLEASFAAREAAKKAGQLGNTTIAEETEEDETFVNELGQIEIKYPTVAGYQVDLFFLGGAEKFHQYRTEGLLASLDAELGDASKKLNQYIFPEFLEGIKTMGGGTTFAIPNNRIIGEYTFLLLNKQALNNTLRRIDGGNTSFESYTALTAKECERFLDDVHEYQNEEFYPLYKDADITTLDIASANVQYYGVDENGKLCDEFSIIGAYHLKGDTYGTVPEIGSILDNTTFVNSLRTLKKYENEGYYYDAATDEGKKFAVGYVKGGTEVYEQYGDEYEIVVIENPTLTGDMVLESTFAVGANTISLSRSMQVLTLLNTDEEFRNLLLYGIEGEHYRLVDTDLENALGDTYKQADRLNNKYKMDPIKTGNVMISYPTMEQLPNVYDLGIKQNQNVRVEQLLNFDLKASGYSTDYEALEAMRALSAELWAEYESCTDFDRFLSFAQNKFDQNGETYDALYVPHADGGVCEDPTCKSFVCAYIAWLEYAGLLAE